MLVFTISCGKKFFSVYAYLGFLTPTVLGCLFFLQNWKAFLYNFVEEVPFPITICFLLWPYPRALLLLCFLSWCVNIVFNHPALRPYALASLLVSIFTLLFDSLSFSFSIFFPPRIPTSLQLFSLYVADTFRVIVDFLTHFDGISRSMCQFWILNWIQFITGPQAWAQLMPCWRHHSDLKTHYKGPNVCQNGNKDLTHQRPSP